MSYWWWRASIRGNVETWNTQDVRDFDTVDGSEIPRPTTVWMVLKLLYTMGNTTNLNWWVSWISEPSTLVLPTSGGGVGWFLSKWWFQIFFGFYTDPWGNDPIWRLHILQTGLVNNHQLVTLPSWGWIELDDVLFLKNLAQPKPASWGPICWWMLLNFPLPKDVQLGPRFGWR